jgi:hypothetical protein
MMTGKATPQFNQEPPQYNTMLHKYNNVQLQYNIAQPQYSHAQFNQVPQYNTHHAKITLGIEEEDEAEEVLDMDEVQ